MLLLDRLHLSTRQSSRIVRSRALPRLFLPQLLSSRIRFRISPLKLGTIHLSSLLSCFPLRAIHFHRLHRTSSQRLPAFPLRMRLILFAHSPAIWSIDCRTNMLTATYRSNGVIVSPGSVFVSLPMLFHCSPADSLLRDPKSPAISPSSHLVVDHDSSVSPTSRTSRHSAKSGSFILRIRCSPPDFSLPAVQLEYLQTCSTVLVDSDLPSCTRRR